MPNAYTWQFVALDVFLTYQNETDVVFNVHWRLHADDGLGHVASVYGDQRCGDVDPDNFIPFDELTSVDVQGWVEEQMGADEIDELHATLDASIADQINPPSVSMAPPWL